MSIHKKAVAVVRDLANRVSARLGGSTYAAGSLAVTTGFDTSGYPTMSVGAGSAGGQNAFIRVIEAPSLGTNAVGNAQDSYGPLIAQVALETIVIGSTLALAASPTGATWSNSVATFTTSAPHGLSTGMEVAIAGVTNTGYDGTYGPITVTSTTVFTVPLLASSTLSASGSGTAQQVLALLDSFNQMILLGEVHSVMSRVDLWLLANGTAPTSISAFSSTAVGTSGVPVAVYDSNVYWPLIGNM
jgi:hypothetical protein